jgi:hypothetical protein
MRRLGRDTIFLVRAPHDDLDCISRQRSLQRLRFIPWRTHPYVALFVGDQDHRRRLRVDWFDDRVGRTGDPTTGDSSDARVIRKFGTVPDDLSPL